MILNLNITTDELNTAFRALVGASERARGHDSAASSKLLHVAAELALAEQASKNVATLIRQKPPVDTWGVRFLP